MLILRQFFCKEITGRLQPLPVALIKYIWKCRLVRQSVLNGSKKRIYDAEYGYDMSNNVSKFTSSAGGVSMTERFDYTISLSKPARRRKYKVQNAVLCGGVFCA